MLLSLIVVFSVLFTATHFGLSHGAVRAGLVKQFGPVGFRGVYSLISIGTLAPAATFAWIERHAGPVLWDLPRWIELAVSLPLMLLATILLVLSLASPSPVSMVPARPEARGVLRITRHPMNMGFGLFGVAHVVANGALGDVAFFGLCFAVVGIVGAYHQDARIAKAKGEALREFRRATSVLPFAAILRGRQKFDPGDMAWPLVALAVVAWGALVFFHGRLFGAPLLFG
jgi:uncharacterized membrane protein